jgi:hypothetical protein
VVLAKVSYSSLAHLCRRSNSCITHSMLCRRLIIVLNQSGHSLHMPRRISNNVLNGCYGGQHLRSLLCSCEAGEAQ